ncbi:MAG: 50S ribosomal protein L11 methyltransferase [Bdellovibrio sp.]|nr:MAG: 50S ribosomal protein L11 methyltransferase [Bdellovibrio sp.]
MAKSYIRIQLSQVPEELEDVIANHGIQCGSSGCAENLSFRQPDLSFDPQIIAPRKKILDLYFTERPGCEFFDQLLAWHSEIQWHIFEEEEKDWLAEWKKDFKPFSLAGPYWIVPSWLETPVSEDFTLRIDPGMAFGTGTHATSRMAAHFILRVHRLHSPGSRSTALLDVGTGTAVLAILAAKLAFAPVTGLEIDPEARRVARENVNLNRVDVEISDEAIDEHQQTYQVVVANIIDGVLTQIKDQLLRVLKPRGDLYVTGILADHEDRFFANFVEPLKLRIVRRDEEDGWVGLWLRRSQT